jgi:2,4-diaminopentanoate dehydrogenase
VRNIGMRITAVPVINAIPAVCAAPAGVATYADLPVITSPLDPTGRSAPGRAQS